MGQRDATARRISEIDWQTWEADDPATLATDDPTVLTDYLDAVTRRTLAYLDSVADESEWDRIVDERWDPPVTARVRLASIVSDDLQHVGQAAYLRGLYERR